MARFDLSDEEWTVIAPLLPEKGRGPARKDDRLVLIPLKKSPFEVDSVGFWAARRKSASRPSRWLRLFGHRNEFRELSEVLCGGCEEEFVVGAAWPAQPEPSEA